MIANLVSTLLLALGVATGNVSSNVYKGGNAFNHEEKKPIKKANEPTQQVYADIDNLYVSQEYIPTADYNINKKAYYGTENSATVYEPYINIYNTLYFSARKDPDTKLTRMYQVVLLEIYNYTDTSWNSINVQMEMVLQSVDGREPVSRNLSWYVSQYNNSEQIRNKFDLNLTAYSNAETEYENIPEITENRVYNITDNENFNFTHDQTRWYYRKTLNRTIEYIPARSSTQIVFAVYARCYIYDAATTGTGFFLSTTGNVLYITGTPIEQQYNYEVIDVPNLMFTIITLPFAWYSTAFNLTIFPGTPYQLNFGNLVMTIVAALILLYLIRKIIK